MVPGRMVLLTTVADPATARILAAHLGAEGVVWQLRGNVEGPYPVGPVEVLVGEDDLELARLVVDAEPAELAAEPDDEPAPGRVGPWLLLAVIGVPLVVALLRVLAEHLL